LTVGDDPRKNLSWTSVGFDPHAGVYPAGQFFNNALDAASRLRAEEVNRFLKVLEGMRAINNGPNVARRIVKQLIALTEAFAAGHVLYGPILGYGYVCGHRFGTYVPDNPLEESFPMPVAPSGEHYDYYVHVGIALDGIRMMLQDFRCWRSEVLDVRNSGAVGQQTTFREANTALLHGMFYRAGLSNFRCIDGCSPLYLLPALLDRRQFVSMSEEGLPPGENKFFYGSEPVSYFLQAKLQYIWAMGKDPTGEFCLWKVSGTIEGREFTPNPRPERRRVTYNTLDGLPPRGCPSGVLWVCHCKRLRLRPVSCMWPDCAGGWSLCSGTFVEDRGLPRVLVMHLQKAPTVSGRNMQNLHLIRLDTIAEHIRAVMDVNKTDADVQAGTVQDWWS
jgi:hypothetical protein